MGGPRPSSSRVPATPAVAEWAELGPRGLGAASSLGDSPRQAILSLPAAPKLVPDYRPKPHRWNVLPPVLPQRTTGTIGTAPLPSLGPQHLPPDVRGVRAESLASSPPPVALGGPRGLAATASPRPHPGPCRNAAPSAFSGVTRAGLQPWGTSPGPSGCPACHRMASQPSQCTFRPRRGPDDACLGSTARATSSECPRFVRSLSLTPGSLHPSPSPVDP